MSTPAKRSRPDQDDKVSSSTDADGAGISTTEAGQGLADTQVIPRALLPEPSFKVTRNLRLSFVNAVQSRLWANTASASSYASDFFEIPHNHIGFWIPNRAAGMMSTASAYKFSNPKWSIRKVTMCNSTLQKATPVDTFLVSGNTAPSFDTLYDTSVEPSRRTRIWMYDAAGNKRTSLPDANSAARITDMANRAEYSIAGLPLIQFDEPVANMTIPPAWHRYVRNHTLDSTISCTPKYFGGWRRNCYDTSRQFNAAAPLDMMVPFAAGDTRPFVTTGTVSTSQNANTFIQSDWLGEDSKWPHFYYRSGQTNQRYQEQNVNSNYFIRVRDFPKVGSGDAGGSDFTTFDQQNHVYMSLVLDITTEIDVELDYKDQTAGSFQWDSAYNQPLWWTRSVPAYNVGNENSAIIVPFPAAALKSMTPAEFNSTNPDG